MICGRYVSRGALTALLLSSVSVSIARAEPHATNAELSPARVKTVVQRNASQVGIHTSQVGDVDEISIETSSEQPAFEVTRLSNPPRLVIDLKNEKSRGGKTIPVAHLDHVSAIRLGTHASSSRIVLDLAEGVSLSHHASSARGKVVVTLTSGGDIAPALKEEVVPVTVPVTKPESVQTVSAAPVVEVKAEPQLPTVEDEEKSDEAIDEDADAPSLQQAYNEARKGTSEVTEVALSKADDAVERGSESVNGGTSPSEDPSSVEQASHAVSAPIVRASLNTATSSGKVKSVRLEAVGDEANALKVDVDGAPEFTIERTAPSEYVLALKGCSVADSAQSSTIFSDSQNTTIRSARATTKGGDALIRIFSKPEVYLSARWEGGKLLVEETKDLGQVVDDMRAQLAPQSAKDAVAKEKDADKGNRPTEKPVHAAEKKDGKEAKTPAVSTDSKEAKAEKASDAKKSGDPATTKDPLVTPKDDQKKTNKKAGELSDGEIQALIGDTSRYTGKLISLDLQEADIDNALRIIAEVSNLNIVASEDVVGKVTLRLSDVPWDQALDVILKTHGLDKVLEGNVMRIAPIDKLQGEREALKRALDAQIELEPLRIKYIRVSYGRAAELKTLAETALSERGSVAYDERSNQIVVKDIESAIAEVEALVNKVDLRTPQVLLETQIVEASRGLSRELGSELGFQYIQSPATGNGTGLNFPAAISVGGSAAGAGSITGSSFPAAVSSLGGSALTMLFDSADGTKTLEMRLSQLESEGRARIVSRPAVATTNNKAAEIKSVQKLRVRLPNGGTSVATGAGASAVGAGGLATETIEAGIILNVTPQVSPDYYVLLDIKAKSSSFSYDARNPDGIPTEIERSASSSVLVSSGQTFALGGIYKITETEGLNGTPFLKDVPFLGTFFRRSKTDGTDEELLFFITPRVVEGSFDEAAMKAAS